MKIVVVEDEIRIREGIHALIEMLGDEYEFAGEAENGVKGLELIREVLPDLVITDIRMPDMDGLEMLQCMEEEQIHSKGIVLSAYSEFEYARTAIRLGVTEYLLKPIAVEEFTKALNNVKEQLKREAVQKPEQIGTIEQVIGGLIYGQIEADESVRDYLKTKYGFREDQPIIEISIYLGKAYEEHVEKTKRIWEEILSERGDFQFCIVKIPNERSLLAVIYDYKNLLDIERRVQYRILQERQYQCQLGNIGWILADNLQGIKESFYKIYNAIDWNITLGSGVIVNYYKISQLRTILCVYPLEIENEIKTALCIGERKKVEEGMERFHQYFKESSLYLPKDIKQCYVRMIWAVINVAKEVNLLDYMQVNQQQLLDQIMNAKIRTELTELTGKIISNMDWKKESGKKEEELLVKRMKAMVHEFYSSGITLDEIAAKLNVTPEYLSVQFHKTVGETYSNYIKNYRIAKAKELLIGTQMKLYEIAKEVGYSDGKYFSKVFRECTGYLPADYRKAYK